MCDAILRIARAIAARLPIWAIGLIVASALPERASAGVDVNGDGRIEQHAPVPQEIVGSPVPRGGGLMLVDRSHGENISAGLPEIVSSLGWGVVEHFGAPITPELLAPYDAVLIQASVGFGYPGPPGPGIAPFSDEEVAAIGSFYAAGRGVWIFCDYTQDPTGANSVASQFGVTFNLDIILDPDASNPVWPQITDIVPHPVTDGITSYSYLAGCSLNASPPAVVLATADENAYSDVYPAGTFPPVLAVVENSAGGCGVFHGDNTSVPLPMIVNILECLRLEGPVSVEPTSWGAAKARYR